MTMHYRLLWLIGLIWCLSLEVNCEEGRSFISRIKNELENNRIDLESGDDQSSRTYKNLDLQDDSNNLINSIPLNSINHNSHKFLNRRRRSAKETIKRKNLGERYPSDSSSTKTYEEAVKFLKDNDLRASKISRQTNEAQWAFDSNLTEHNKQLMLDASLRQAKFDLDTYNEAKSYAWKQFNDSSTKRWFKNLVTYNQLAIGESKFQELNLITADLTDIYSKAKLCKYEDKSNANCKPTLELEPDLNLLLKEKRDYDELTYYWTEWRKQSGKKMRSKYLRYVELMNESARKNGELWRENFLDDETFEEELEEQVKKIQPLYKLLHAYVRKQLRKQFGDHIKPDGPIPASILGNMWAQDWSQGANLKLLLPFPERKKADLSEILKEKNLTAHDMFKLGESFFVSLGLDHLPENFWKHSIIEKPNDREIVCHASAWDFGSDEKGELDVRIKMCTRIEHEDLVVIHHEQGHIYYYLDYSKQPLVFRNGANSGFHEAIGDCIALSVQLPKHLKTIGLLEDEDKDDNSTCTEDAGSLCGEKKDELNFLMEMALQKIGFIPFGYIIDKWRWDLFSGKISKDDMNSQWWKLRAEYQGICPPTLRTENDFDPGAKYHVPASVPYLRYFVAHILQFQFHKYLCEAAGHTGRLSQCDIYNSKEAGKRLSSALKLGSSVPWPETLKVFSGGKESKMNVDGLVEYFEPLIEWLKKELKDEKIGWTTTDWNVCP